MRVLRVFGSAGWDGLLVNVSAVWAALAGSILLLIVTGGSPDGEGGPPGAPWTPPGPVIGGVWTLLYTLMGMTLWAVNHIPTQQQPRARGVVLLLIGFCLVWPFYAFNTESRWPGLLGNLGILALAILAVIQLRPMSRFAAGLVLPVAIWITVATATILDGAVRYGW